MVGGVISSLSKAGDLLSGKFDAGLALSWLHPCSGGGRLPKQVLECADGVHACLFRWCMCGGFWLLLQPQGCDSFCAPWVLWVCKAGYMLSNILIEAAAPEQSIALALSVAIAHHANESVVGFDFPVYLLAMAVVLKVHVSPLFWSMVIARPNFSSDIT